MYCFVGHLLFSLGSRKVVSHVSCSLFHDLWLAYRKQRKPSLGVTGRRQLVHIGNLLIYNYGLLSLKNVVIRHLVITIWNIVKVMWEVIPCVKGNIDWPCDYCQGPLSEEKRQWGSVVACGNVKTRLYRSMLYPNVYLIAIYVFQ